MVCNKSSSNHYVPVDIPLHATYYVDDIAVSGDDYQGLVQLKGYLNSHFHMKDLVQWQYFLDIKVVRSKKFLSQWKYLTVDENTLPIR